MSVVDGQEKEVLLGNKNTAGWGEVTLSIRRGNARDCNGLEIAILRMVLRVEATWTVRWSGRLRDGTGAGTRSPVGAEGSGTSGRWTGCSRDRGLGRRDERILKVTWNSGTIAALGGSVSVKGLAKILLIISEGKITATSSRQRDPQSRRRAL